MVRQAAPKADLVRMNPPRDTLLHEHASLLIWRPRGVINEAIVNQVIAYLGDLEARPGQPFNRFTDTAEVEATDLNFHYIFHVSLFRRLSYRGPPIKSAILVTNDTVGRYSRMHALLTQGSAINVRLFEKRLFAAEWLDVPVALLEKEPAGFGTT
jgi:hypothetical protein